MGPRSPYTVYIAFLLPYAYRPATHHFLRATDSCDERVRRSPSSKKRRRLAYPCFPSSSSSLHIASLSPWGGALGPAPRPADPRKTRKTTKPRPDPEITRPVTRLRPDSRTPPPGRPPSRVHRDSLGRWVGFLGLFPLLTLHSSPLLPSERWDLSELSMNSKTRLRCALVSKALTKALKVLLRVGFSSAFRLLGVSLVVV